MCLCEISKQDCLVNSIYKLFIKQYYLTDEIQKRCQIKTLLHVYKN